MNGHASESADDPHSFDARRVERAAAALELQRSPDDGEDRARLAAALRRIGSGATDPADDPVAEDLALLDRSSLGHPAVHDHPGVHDHPAGDERSGGRGHAEEAAARAVALVLDRLDALDRQGRSREVAAVGEIPTRGPVANWNRELRRLFEAGTRSLPEVAEELAGRGIHVPPHTLLDAPLLDDPGLAEAVVDVLGGRWVEGGYRQLYRAARRERPWSEEARPAAARCGVSGLPGAEAVDSEAVTAQVAAPIHEVPRVRGRHRLIDRLADGLQVPARRVQVLVGDAGYGKSTVALAVAQRADADQLIALWVSASDVDTVLEGLRLVAIRLGATASDLEAAWRADRTDWIQRLWKLLDASPSRWLLVLDDAGPDAVGQPGWVHRSVSGTVLVTSRFGDAAGWGPDAEVTEVGNLDPEHGGRVVLDCIRASGSRVDAGMEAPARELSRRLAGMPLALLSAGNLVASGIGDRTLGNLVEVFGARTRSGPVGATYDICLQAISPSGQSMARDLLRQLACFAPDEPLPMSVLDGYTLPTDRDGHGPTWRTVLADLVGVGLVEELPVGRHTQRCVRIHLAVAEHSQCDPAFDLVASSRVDATAVGLLFRELDRIDAGVPGNWPPLRRLEPHVSELMESPALQSDDLRAAVLRLADRMSAALMRTGSHPTAEALLDRALLRTAPLGDEHPARLDARHTRAWMVVRGGNLAFGQELLERLLGEKTALFGPEHPSTLTTEDCLAWTMAEQGALTTARLLFARILDTRTRVLGSRHPDTLATRHRLAWVTGLCGDEPEAAAEFATVLELRRATLGSDHMDVYSTRYRLAWALGKRGRYAEAERQFRSLLADLEAVVGRNHPMTLVVRSRMAWVMAWRNRFAEAQRRYTELLSDQEKVLGVGHPRALRTQQVLACLKLQLGQVEQAARELRAVADAREAALGPDHHYTLESRSYLAWALYQGGRTADADREFQAVLTDRQRVLGPTHPVTLLTRCLLARVLIRRGRLADAEDRLNRLLVDQLVVLPADHRYVFDTRHSLAYARGLQGRLDECEAELRAVLVDRTAVLGQEHRDTLATRDHLTWVLGLAGRTAQAREECESLLADRVRLLGADHPHTLTSRYRQAWLLGLDGGHSAALDLFEQLLVDRRRALGDAHLDTLRCRGAIVQTLRLCGRLDEAATAARSLLRDQLRVDVVEGPDGVSAQEELELVRRAAVGEAGS